tara:strand:+ start:1202 stop:1777 length:576 start_codon:yes stop_codon:yes gene_type:complete
MDAGTKKILVNLDVKVKKTEEEEEVKEKKIKLEKKLEKRIVSKETEDIINSLKEETKCELDYLLEIRDCSNMKENNICKLLIKGIKQKINGYKVQDKKKKLLDEEKFVDFDEVLNLLINADKKCYYCKNEVLLIYEDQRQKNQWSLDRIDNDIGHIKGNLLISCLDCNLKRKTMYHGRYAFTKQLNIVKIE